MPVSTGHLLTTTTGIGMGRLSTRTAVVSAFRAVSVRVYTCTRLPQYASLSGLLPGGLGWSTFSIDDGGTGWTACTARHQNRTWSLMASMSAALSAVCAIFADMPGGQWQTPHTRSGPEGYP